MEDRITIFAYMTHTHMLGAEVTGYKVHEKESSTFARGDPQEPQTFHELSDFETIEKGDTLGATCTFDGTRTDRVTRAGHRTEDVMCKLFLMYYQRNDTTSLCIDNKWH